MSAAAGEEEEEEEEDDAAPEDEDDELTCVVVDITPAAYARGAAAAPLEEAVSAVWALLNALTGLARARGACRAMVLGLLPGRYVTLYDPLLSGDGAPPAEVLRAGVLRELEAHGFGGAGDRGAPVALAPALSRALCWIHKARGGVMAAATDRLLRERGAGGGALGPARAPERAPAPAKDAGAGARVLVLLASRDPAEQYVGVMNAIFAAQGAGVVIDGVPLHRLAGARAPPQSEFLQQMCSMTGGSYVAPMRDDALVNYFKLFLATGVRERRRLLRAGGDAGGVGNVGNRPSCFCHKRAIAIGYVCSVCLSVFCYRVDACLMCGQSFVEGPRCVPAQNGREDAAAGTR